jgi:predicted nucleic acid-binding protein
VPAFWRHEVLNALMVGERRKRLTGELSQAFLQDLERLPTEVDIPSAGTVFHLTQDLCRKHGLTAYDAAYLGLAIRHRLALATADAALDRAARAEGVEVV